MNDYQLYLLARQRIDQLQRIGHLHAEAMALDHGPGVQRRLADSLGALADWMRIPGLLRRPIAAAAVFTVFAVVVWAPAWAQAPARHDGDAKHHSDHDQQLDRELQHVLRKAGFTGRIDAALESRLGRELDPRKIELGRLLFFDKILGLHSDNSCAGCHGPANGFGDSQPIAIGVDNNNIVGPNRAGPRNQRRSPSVSNTIFYPALMWTARFTAPRDDPFDSTRGFLFPPPENTVFEPTLLASQASLASTELVEMAGFTGIRANPGSVNPRVFIFDDGDGQALPAPDPTSGFHNFPIQDAVQARLNAIPAYQALFSAAFNGGVPLPPGGITISMRRQAIAEFQSSLTAVDAPIDRFARGHTHAMTTREKHGALLFFGKANCVACHAVAGQANEMFSDFKNHRIGGPQLAPVFGVGTSNVIYDGPDENEDFGFEQTTGNQADRYTFRTGPLRNLKVARAFFHNGAFGTIAAAIAHHLDVRASLRNYDPRANGVPPDLTVSPFDGVLAAGIDPLVQRPIKLTKHEFEDLVAFVEDALFDKRVLDFCDEVPPSVPSGRPLQTFEGCQKARHPSHKQK
ncbi:MAG TPA: cytochrome c peroxidase [Burkholderiales bacterium]|nr:cytochrome c peroxidase [Burkholderiales bacterium]